MYELTTLDCTLTSADIHGCEFLVENLETPNGESYGAALLRATDIIAISVHGSNRQSSEEDCTSNMQQSDK